MTLSTTVVPPPPDPVWAFKSRICWQHSICLILWYFLLCPNSRKCVISNIQPFFNSLYRYCPFLFADVGWQFWLTRLFFLLLNGKTIVLYLNTTRIMKNKPYFCPNGTHIFLNLQNIYPIKSFSNILLS